VLGLIEGHDRIIPKFGFDTAQCLEDLAATFIFLAIGRFFGNGFFNRGFFGCHTIGVNSSNNFF